VAHELGFAHRHSWSQLHVGNGQLAFVTVGPANRRCVYDSRMCDQGGFDGEWIDVMASADDEVLRATAKPDIGASNQTPDMPVPPPQAS
jgi:hypothetical protein